MSSILSMDIFDIARSLGAEPLRATPLSVCNWLLSEYASRKGGQFNYNPAIETTFDAFRGGHSLESAVLACRTRGNPMGWNANASAIEAIMPYVLENISVCHRIGLTAVAIGRFSGKTVYARVKAPLLRVKDGQAFVVLPGFRRAHRPHEAEIDFACSFGLEVLAQGDNAKADFEYLYAGPGLGQGRHFQAIHGCDRRRFSSVEIDSILDVFVNGVFMAQRAGANAESPVHRGYRIIDPNAPSFI